MLYFILGILTIIAVQSIVFLKYYERGLKINFRHMLFSVFFSLYLVFVIEFLHDRSVSMNYELLIVLLLFIPIGLVPPFVYQRYKYFRFEILFTIVLMAHIAILQNSSTGKLNPLEFLFGFLGLVLGFFFFICLFRIKPELRKKMILKKRKRKIVISLYEVEIITMCFMILFSTVSAAEKISGKNFNQKLKDTIRYSPDNNSNSNGKYDGIYYAEKKKTNRYDAYAKKHPDMSKEEVVWRVDANLDQEFYDEDYVRYSDLYTNDPLLINKFRRVSDDFVPAELVKIEGDKEATPVTVEAYKKMTKDMKQEGLKVYVVSAYRSVSYQRELYKYYCKSDTKKNVDTYSARPGYSEHHSGRALDISQVPGNLNAFEGSDEAEWVYHHAYEYGFIVRYPENQIDVTGYIYEPWHIVYVGTDISRTMHDNNINTLEEYVVKYVDHQPR